MTGTQEILFGPQIGKNNEIHVYKILNADDKIAEAKFPNSATLICVGITTILLQWRLHNGCLQLLWCVQCKS